MTLFLIDCKNITNFLFLVLWTYLATFIKNSNPKFYKLWCLSACKKYTPFLTFFWDVVKILEICSIEYIENFFFMKLQKTESKLKVYSEWKYILQKVSEVTIPIANKYGKLKVWIKASFCRNVNAINIWNIYFNSQKYVAEMKSDILKHYV